MPFKFKEPIGKTAPNEPSLKPLESLLSARQTALLNLVKTHQQIAMADILLKLDNPPSDRMLRKELNILRKKHLIRLEGRAKSAKWVINQ